MVDLRFRVAGPADLLTARRILATTFAGEPFSFGMYGESALDRVAGTTAEYSAWPESEREVLVAVVGDAVVGVIGTSPPGRCHLCDAPVAEPAPDAPAAEWIDHEFQLRCRDAHRAHLTDDHSHITPVAVDHAVQGSGVGRRLVAAAVDRVKDTGAPVVLECVTRRVDFYAGCGFRVVAEFDDPGGPGLRAAFMRLDP